MKNTKLLIVVSIVVAVAATVGAVYFIKRRKVATPDPTYRVPTDLLGVTATAGGKPKRIVHVTLPYHDIWPQSQYNHPRPINREYIPIELNPYLQIPTNPQK